MYRVGTLGLASRSSNPQSVRRRAAWLLVVLASACGSDHAGPSDANLIGPDGGSVQIDDLELVIPKGALAKPTKITLARESGVTAIAGKEVQVSFELGPAGTVFNVPAQAFLDHGQPTGAAALYLSDDGKSWTRIADSKFDAVRGQWTGSIAHFSHLALQVDTAADAAGGAAGADDGGGAGGKAGAGGADSADGGPAGAPSQTSSAGAAGDSGPLAAGGDSECDCAAGADGQDPAGGGTGGAGTSGGGTSGAGTSVGGVAITGTEWQRQIGSGNGDRMADSTTDAQGNVLIVGNTGGVMPGATKVGSSDVFVLKYSPLGDLDFVTQFGTVGGEQPSGVGRDAQNNSYVFGVTDSAFSGFTNAGGQDLFVSKLSATGSVLWTKQLGSSDDDYAADLVTDGSGNSYMTGSTVGNLDGHTNQSGDSGELFVLKYDAAGVKQWSRFLGQSGASEGNAITLGPSGEVYVVATAGSYPGQTPAGARDILTLKYDATGAVLWGRLFGTVGQDFGSSIATDSGGNVYVAGEVTDSPSGGFVDYVLVKYDSAGNLKWSRRGGVADKGDYLGAVTTDPSGNVYLTGRTAGALDGQTSAGSEDAFLIKYAADGTRKWTRQFGTNLTDWGSSVTSDAAGNLFASGLTYGGLGGKVSQTGKFQVFLLKFPSSALAD